MAEQLKKENCNLAEKEDPDQKEEPAVQVNFDGVGKIYKKDISDIVKARVDEIMKLLVSQLVQQVQSQSYLAYVSEFPAGLVLTGGTANLAGIRTIAQDITGLPTRVGIPPAMSGLADQLHNAAYASSVGILLCGGKNWRQEQSWIRSETGIREKVVDRVKSVRQLVPWGRP
jgi:cell division protein FtsA